MLHGVQNTTAMYSDVTIQERKILLIIDSGAAGSIVTRQLLNDRTKITSKKVFPLFLCHLCYLSLSHSRNFFRSIFQKGTENPPKTQSHNQIFNHIINPQKNKCSKQFSGILQDLKIRSVKNSLHSVFKFCEQKEMPHLGDVKHERYNIIDQFGEI